MLKLTTKERNRANKMLYGILYSEVYRCCFPSLADKSQEELLKYTLMCWDIKKSCPENAYLILCRLVGQERTDKRIFKRGEQNENIY